MENINDLINCILAEAKAQKEQREAYTNLIHGLVDGTEIKGSNGNTWRVSFRWYSDIMGGEMISFGREISKRKNGLSTFNKECLYKANKEIDQCINYLLDCGTETVDAFIKHLTKVAIPQFLQDKHPHDYEIKRNVYVSMCRIR